MEGLLSTGPNPSSLGIYKASFGHIFGYLGHDFSIFLSYLRHILGIPWVYILHILWISFPNSLKESCAYLMHILSKSLVCPLYVPGMS